jgi:hypothetical protein
MATSEPANETPFPQLRPHPIQIQYWKCDKRFVAVPSGRRSGKTELAKRRLIKRAWAGTNYYPARFFVAAPTFNQAVNIYWNDLKRYCFNVAKFYNLPMPSISEGYKTIKLPLSEIMLVSMDKPERIEGQPWDGGVLDEYGNMKEKAWMEHVRPALSDRRGWCDFIGVPEGWNHYKELCDYAQREDTPDWAHFHWISADILPAEEIEAAKAELDELVYRQEYEGSFENFSGRAYYNFQRSDHCANLEYNPKAPLIFCFDFNVEPGVAAVAQEKERGTAVIGEVHIPRNSSTEAVCKRLIHDWHHHKGLVKCYGDATGGARGSAKVAGSDWDLIRQHLRPVFRDNLILRVPNSNPAERARINALNSRLRSANGNIRMMVDPIKAKHVVKDLEGVTLLEGGSGEIDKKKTPDLSHISDALGYYIAREFPIKGGKSQIDILEG